MPQLVGQMAMAKFQQSLQPKEEKPDFTLGQGEQRFDATGKLIASGGERPLGNTIPELTRAALDGNKKAQTILDKMMERDVEKAGKSNEALVAARLATVDLEGTAKGIIAGRILMADVKNTFGIPVQEAVRAEVLKIDQKFNFALPQAAYKALSSSLRTQEKQRGMMGSFVRNLNKQITRVDEMGQELGRLGVRVLDLPKREAITRLKGSGAEKAYEAYMLEISNEIAKLSTGSSQSIRELSTDAQERWGKIHDPNLSINEMKKILSETRTMAQMRITSTDEELQFTRDRIVNLVGDRRATTPEQPGKTEIERRETEDGQIIIKFSDGTYDYE